MTTISAARSYAKDINRAAAPFAVVTGASTVIGLELARQCAAHGANVLVASETSLGVKALWERRHSRRMTDISRSIPVGAECDSA
jgi:NAD(P)-dependent dehydrogenase (short-subunit alcohol dehydrogenase family)